MLVNRAANPSAVKSIQRGTVTMAANLTTVDVVLAEVNLAKVALSSSCFCAGAVTLSADGLSAVSVGARMLSSTVVRLERSTPSLASSVYWEVIEYV